MLVPAHKAPSVHSEKSIIPAAKSGTPMLLSPIHSTPQNDVLSKTKLEDGNSEAVIFAELFITPNYLYALKYYPRLNYLSEFLQIKLPSSGPSSGVTWKSDCWPNKSRVDRQPHQCLIRAYIFCDNKLACRLFATISAPSDMVQYNLSPGHCPSGPTFYHVTSISVSAGRICQLSLQVKLVTSFLRDK